nr:PcfJ domain-containing protein [Enterococcus faecalis]
MLLDDIYDMAQMLHKKITLNFTTVKGMRRYHDSLVELLNKQKQRKLKDFTFSFPQKFDQLIEAAEQDSRFEVIKTHKELFLEGLEMHHCVYSYLNLVMKGKCMILKYKDAEHRYTFEVRKRKNRKYSVRQCYGKYDSLPEPEIEHSIRAFTESVPCREMERA